MSRLSYDSALLDRPVTCPAGEKIHERPEGPSCRCRIEGSTITASFDGSSLAHFCMGAHTLCPTWRLAREAEWVDQDVTRLFDPEGAGRNYTIEDLEQIEECRAAGDLEGAMRLIRQIRERRAAQGLVDLRPDG